MLLGQIISGLIAYWLNAMYSGEFANYSIPSQVKDILPSFCVAMAMFVCLFALSFLSLEPAVMLAVQVSVGAVLVISLSKFFKLSEYEELISILLNMSFPEKS